MDTLQREIDEAARTVRTDHYDLSIGEITSMYEANEIQIDPAFQRLFRWKSEQKSKLIESFLLSIPIPSIFVFERADNVWELIDGLQRLSTILEFIGLLRSPDTQERLPPSTLVGTRYLPLLDEIAWESSNSGQPCLSRAQQISIKRARISVEILRRGTDEKSKFDLFQRLNGSGSPLTPQEMRNCIILMHDPLLHSDILSIAHHSLFREIVQRLENQIEKQEHVEYAVRFLVYTFVPYLFPMDVQPYLDDGVLKLNDQNISRGTNYLALFEGVFGLIRDAVGPNGLKRHDGNQFAGRVGLVGLEVIAAGIAANYDAIRGQVSPVKFVKDRIYRFWTRDEASEFGRAGMRGSDRLRRTLPFGRRWFDPAFVP